MNFEIPADDIEQLADVMESGHVGMSAYVIRGGSAVGVYIPDECVNAPETEATQ